MTAYISAVSLLGIFFFWMSFFFFLLIYPYNEEYLLNCGNSWCYQLSDSLSNICFSNCSCQKYSLVSCKCQNRNTQISGRIRMKMCLLLCSAAVNGKTNPADLPSESFLPSVHIGRGHYVRCRAASFSGKLQSTTTGTLAGRQSFQRWENERAVIGKGPMWGGPPNWCTLTPCMFGFFWLLLLCPSNAEEGLMCA